MEIQNPFQIQWDRTPYQSFPDYFFSKIALHGSNMAIVDTDTGKQWRYSEIREWCFMAMDRLRELGVNEKSRVAVITGTTGQAIFIHIACTMLGCPAVAVNGHFTVDEIWQMVDLSESTHCVTESSFVQKTEDVRRKAQMRGGGRIKAIRAIEDVLSRDSLSTDRKQNPRPPPPLAREPSTAKIPLQPTFEERVGDPATPTSEIAECNGKSESEETYNSPVDCMPSSGNPMMIFFTAGTTGLPKPVEFTHKSLVINLQQLTAPLYGPVQAKEHFLLPLSISHCFGFISAFYALVNGATIYTINKWSTKSLVTQLAVNKINVVHCYAPMINILATDPMIDQNSFPSLRSIIVSGSPIDSNVMKICKERLKIRDIRQAYGMTELGGICAIPHCENQKMNSVGVPLPGMLFKVVNWETKQVCGPRQPGQLLVMGPQVMPSYFRNPKATSDILDASGYCKTGDAAFYDEDGHLHVMDRIKDIVKYKGTLVCPSEVEALLRAHAAIEDCAVVGRQDHVAGEVPAAFVVKDAGHPLLASAEVRQYVSGKIAQFKELRGGVFFISEIPRSACGKVLRRQLKQFWDRERTNSKADLTEKPKTVSQPLSKTVQKTRPKTASATRTTKK